MFKNGLTAAAMLIIASHALNAVGQEAEIPTVCEEAFADKEKWAQCAAQAEPNSAPYLLAHMNLGTEAYMAGDFESAARHYDLSAPEGKSTISDISLHAFRAETFMHMGRNDDARVDVDQALRLLDLGAWRIDPQGQAIPLDSELLEQFYTLLIITMNGLDHDQLGMYVERYRKLPSSNEFSDANRVAVLTEIEEYDAAVSLSERVVLDSPENAFALNNHCYLLGLTGDGERGIPYCEQAIKLEPGIGGFLHSYAVALSSAGRCEDAKSALEKARKMEPSKMVHREPLECESE